MVKIKTTHVGSLPRSNELSSLLASKDHKEEISIKKFDEVVRKNVLEVVKKLEIPTIDLVELLFSKHSDPLSLFPFRMFGHYNAKGYRLVSQIILKNLKN